RGLARTANRLFDARPNVGRCGRCCRVLSRLRLLSAREPSRRVAPTQRARRAVANLVSERRLELLLIPDLAAVIPEIHEGRLNDACCQIRRVSQLGLRSGKG